MKFSDMNDIDMNNWKSSASDVTEKGLWVNSSVTFDKFLIEDDPKFSQLKCKTLTKGHHGIFIPHIPYQMLRRYAKKGETVWDPFAGTGTTIDVASLLGINCIASDLIVKRPDVKLGDAKAFNPGTNIQMIIAHPPYANIVSYSEDKNDLSNYSWQDFLVEWEKCVDNFDKYLDTERMFVLVCGDIYSEAEYIPLGYRAAEIIKKKNYSYKGHIVKDFGETKKGWKQRAQLERYRALRGGYWKFAGDNIFILQKQPAKTIKNKIHCVEKKTERKRTNLSEDQIRNIEKDIRDIKIISNEYKISKGRVKRIKKASSV